MMISYHIHPIRTKNGDIETSKWGYSFELFISKLQTCSSFPAINYLIDIVIDID